MSDGRGHDGGIDSQHGHILTHRVNNFKLLHCCGLDDVLVVHLDVNHGVGERSHVGRVEGMEAASAALDSPVASHQLVVEVDTDLRYGVVPSKYQST